GGGHGVGALVDGNLRPRFRVLNERIEVLAKDLRALDDRHLRADRAVGPNLHDQLVIVGALADARVFNLVLDAQDRRKARIHGDDADLAFLAGILVGGAVAAAVFDRHLHHEGHVIGQRGDDVLGVDDFDMLVGGNIRALDSTCPVAFDADRLGLLTGVLHHQALDVQDDVRDVLDDAGNGANFVLNPLDLNARDGAPLEAGEQNAAQTIAE